MILSAQGGERCCELNKHLAAQPAHQAAELHATVAAASHAAQLNMPLSSSLCSSGSKLQHSGSGNIEDAGSTQQACTAPPDIYIGSAVPELTACKHSSSCIPAGEQGKNNVLDDSPSGRLADHLPNRPPSISPNQLIMSRPGTPRKHASPPATCHSMYGSPTASLASYQTVGNVPKLSILQALAPHSTDSRFIDRQCGPGLSSWGQSNSSSEHQISSSDTQTSISSQRQLQKEFPIDAADINATAPPQRALHPCTGNSPSRVSSASSHSGASTPIIDSRSPHRLSRWTPSTSCSSNSQALPSLASSSSQISSSRSSSNSRVSSLLSLNSISQHYFDRTLDPASVAELSEGIGQHEAELLKVPERKCVHTHAYVSGIVLILLFAMLGWMMYSTIASIFRLRAYYAFAILPFVPIGVFFFAFAISTAVRGLMCIGLGGTSPLDRNSQNYSVIKTPIQKGTRLPQVVVQMPVYKESLDEVIKPSYHSVRRAMQYYQDHGGQVKFVVCDDGFQVISAEAALARANFYAQHGICFVARTPSNRQGVFKKASNLNYQLAVSDAIRKAAEEDSDITVEDALLLVWHDWEREFVAAGDLSMDEDCLILLIDADTRVPESCMYDVVGEFAESPKLAYTQHYTEPFSEQCRNYWEKHISAFTRTIYMQGIAVSVAYGDCAPLVGHNAFLRWAALRQIGYENKSCRPGQTKYWSESSVSEDFDMYIRLASIGSFGRYVMYTGPGFQEGVSMTYVDEVIKCKKFAYGACEILLHPFKHWLTRGPFNRTFLTYLGTKNIAWYPKVSMVCYLSSYLAMGAAFYYCLAEALMSVLKPGFHDHFLARSFDVMLTCNVIFSGVGTLCGNVFFQWRREATAKGGSILAITWEHLKGLPTTIIFFYSVLFPMTEACFVYFFGLEVTWGAARKEDTKLTCWQALTNTLLRYKWEYALYSTLLTGYVIVLVRFEIGLYRGWALPTYCIGHIVGPVVLNPRITAVSW